MALRRSVSRRERCMFGTATKTIRKIKPATARTSTTSMMVKPFLFEISLFIESFLLLWRAIKYMLMSIIYHFKKKARGNYKKKRSERRRETRKATARKGAKRSFFCFPTRPKTEPRKFARKRVMREANQEGEARARERARRGSPAPTQAPRLIL